MKLLYLLNTSIFALFLFTQISFGEDIEDVMRAIEELENRELNSYNEEDGGLDLRDEDLDDLDRKEIQDCYGLCHPDDPCDCVIKDCKADNCTSSSGVDDAFKREEENGPSKKIIPILRLFRFCRRGIFRRRRWCGFGKK